MRLVKISLSIVIMIYATSRDSLKKIVENFIYKIQFQ